MGKEEKEKVIFLKMLKDYFKIALRSIRRRRLRSWLTMIGIFIGITVVVALISIGQGMQKAITAEFEQVGSNRIVVAPGGVFFGPSGSSLTTAILDDGDLKVIKKAKGVEFATGMYSESAKVEFKDEVQYVTIFGVQSDSLTRKMLEEIGFFEIESGRQIKETDKYKAVLGYKVATDLFEKDPNIGDKIEVNGQEFSVVGTQKEAGTGIHDVIIRIPLGTARDLFDEPDEYSMIVVKTDPLYETVDVAEDMKKDLRKHRDVEEGEEDFSVQTAQQTIEQIQTILGIVQVVLVGLAAISLLVGGVGIMNTMYTSVLERRKEIGIMKSIGAKNSDILTIFLIESGMLGVVGGAIGILLGLGLSKTGELVALSFGITQLKAHASFLLIVGTILFAFFIGAFSGVFPARQAALLKPVDALRKK